MSTTNKNTKRLENLIGEQKALLEEMQNEAIELAGDSVLAENDRLSAELEAVREKDSALQKENDELKKQLSAAKSALFTKMAEEKLSIFYVTQQKIDRMYYQSEDGVTDRLAKYEEGCRKSIEQTVKSIESYGTSQYDDIKSRLHELHAELEDRHSRVNRYAHEQLENASIHNGKIGEALRDEPLSENEKRAALKQRNIESFIGLNVLSKAGILLFIVGIIMLGRFAYVHMSDVFKGSLIFLLGAVLIGIGELFHRKEKTVFSTALISGGVAVLYAATATGFFAFKLYNETVTFILCAGITALAIALSQQVKSEVVCAFGTVGGYLPVVALFMMGLGKSAADKTFLPVASVYFCLIAIIVFIMTYNKKWYAAQFIGYSMHIIAVGGVSGCAWALRNLAGYGFGLPLAAGFAIVSFLIYLMMPASKIVKGKALTTGDTVLLGINTLSGAISTSVTLRNCFVTTESANRITGIVFLVFAVIYVVLCAFSVREKKENTLVQTVITSVSALVFSMLVVPFVFGMEYAPIAWVAEGLILALVSLDKKLTIPEFAGLLCMLAAVVAYGYNASESYKLYSVISIVNLAFVVAAFWIYSVKGIMDKKNELLYQILEIASAGGTVGFLYYLYQCFIHGPVVNRYCYFTDVAVFISIALICAVVLRIGILKNIISVIASDIAGILLMPATFFVLDIYNTYDYITGYYSSEAVKAPWFSAINLVLLVLVNLGVLIFFARASADIINKVKAPAWIYTAAISVSALMLITATVMVQFDVHFSNVIISAVYIAAACVLLVVGFKKMYTVVRSGGLVLILCAFAKLCFVDTAHLDSGWKIASYFAFGAILIVISYFYQRFSKKLEAEAQNIVEKNSEL